MAPRETSRTSAALAPFTWRADAVVATALVLLTVVVFAPARHFGFLTFDDPDYVTANPILQHGLTWAAVAAAWTTPQAGYWIPITWMSFLGDVAVHGFEPGGFHVTNVVLHTANAVLVYLVFARLTGARGPSAFVAALFAIHPLHVESVAWVTERKDVLSGLFWWLSTWAYVEWVARPGRARFAAALMLFAMGLLAKPILVTLPVVWLLLDAWPLGRLQTGRAWPLVREKLPFVALAAAVSVVTVLTQRTVGAVTDLAVLPVGRRLTNALVSYGTYLVKTMWPSHLAIFYPYDSHTPIGRVVVAAAVLVLATIGAVRLARAAPYVLVGWLWFLVTIVPVAGLTQAGSQAMADRYTYVPLVGIFLIVAWGARDLVSGRAVGQFAVRAIAPAIVLVAAIVARAQVETWRDSLTLWQHAADVVPDNFVAEDALGSILTDDGRPDEALPHFTRALAIDPTFARAHHNFALALMKAGRTSQAIDELRDVVALRPDDGVANDDLGVALARTGRIEEAIGFYERALAGDPNLGEAHANLGEALVESGHAARGIAEFTIALRLRPDDAGTHDRLGRALGIEGRTAEAIGEYRAALRLDPSAEAADVDLAFALLAARDTSDAADAARQAIRLVPGDADAHLASGLALAALSRADEARREFETTLQLDPENPDAQRALAALRTR